MDLTRRGACTADFSCTTLPHRIWRCLPTACPSMYRLSPSTNLGTRVAALLNGDKLPKQIVEEATDESPVD